MTTTGKVVVGILALIIIIGVAVLIFSKTNNTGLSTTTTTAQNDTTGTSASSSGSGNDQGMVDGSISGSLLVGTPTSIEVHYNGTSFSPSTVTITKGTRVDFMNDSSRSMWVASNEHPTHTDYDGTSRTTHCAAGYTGPTPFDECAGSASNYSFTFTKSGSFEYHDHLNASAHGIVIVQ